MSAQITTQEERKAGEVRKHLSFLLRRQIALQKDALMSEADALVNEHFATTAKSNHLKPAQLKNLEGVALSSMSPAEIVKFISRQASKEIEKYEKKPEKRGWTHNDLHEKLKKQIDQIKGRSPGRGTGDLGLKDEVIAEVKGKAESQFSVFPDVLSVWGSKELEMDVQMELLREFISHFATFYVLKAKESSGHSEEDE